MVASLEDNIELLDSFKGEVLLAKTVLRKGFNFGVASK